MTPRDQAPRTGPASAEPQAHLPLRPLRLSDADIAAARGRYSLVELLERHGVTVLGSGLRRTACCPFHDDQSPSLSVYLDDNRYYCFACGARGDAITLVQRLDGLDFRTAVSRLLTERGVAPVTERSQSHDAHKDQAIKDNRSLAERGPTMRQAETLAPAAEPQPAPPRLAPATAYRDLLTIAAALYQTALTASPAALAYLGQRGIAPDTAQCMRVGYAQPGVLLRFLADDAVLMMQARLCGLLDAVSRERLAGRIIIPEFREGRCVWMVGRACLFDVSPANAPASQVPTPVADQHERTRQGARRELRAQHSAPKYLGITVPKPLMGVGVIEQAEGGANGAGLRSAVNRSQTAAEMRLNGVLVVEGPFDLLAAQQWRLPLPCVALVGAHASRQQLGELMRVAAGREIWLALDADPAGDAGAERLRQALVAARYPGVISRLRPPLDAKDFGELATSAGARATVLRALTQVADAGMPQGASASPTDVAACSETGAETGTDVRLDYPNSSGASQGLEDAQ